MKPRRAREVAVVSDYSRRLNDDGDVVSVDPSVRSAGVSLWRGGALRSVATIARRTAGAAAYGEKCLLMAVDVCAWLQAADARPDVLAFEWPQIYHAGKSEVPPQDLVPLAGVGMAVAGMLMPGCAARNIVLDVVTPLPREWSQGVPKDPDATDPWETPRGRWVATCLRKEEREIVPAQHDAIDSVGIGLWLLDRLIRPRVFPGAV